MLEDGGWIGRGGSLVGSGTEVGSLNVNELFFAILYSYFLLDSASWCRVYWHLQINRIHPNTFLPNYSEAWEVSSQ